MIQPHILPLKFSLLQRLFSVPDSPRPWYEVVLWWELRRIPYNAIVGFAGIVSVIAFVTIASLRPAEFEDGPEPFAILIFGFLANVCYTGGWAGELVARFMWKERAAFFGPVMFSLGLLFSIGLCLLPPLFTAIVWITTKP